MDMMEVVVDVLAVLAVVEVRVGEGVEEDSR